MDQLQPNRLISIVLHVTSVQCMAKRKLWPWQCSHQDSYNRELPQIINTIHWHLLFQLKATFNAFKTGTALFPLSHPLFFFINKPPPLEISQNSTLLIWDFTWTEHKGDLIASELKRKRSLWSSVVLRWIYPRKHGSSDRFAAKAWSPFLLRFLFKIFQVSFILDLQELLETINAFFMVDSVFSKEQETC